MNFQKIPLLNIKNFIFKYGIYIILGATAVFLFTTMFPKIREYKKLYKESQNEIVELHKQIEQECETIDSLESEIKTIEEYIKSTKVFIDLKKEEHEENLDYIDNLGNNELIELLSGRLN